MPAKNQKLKLLIDKIRNSMQECMTMEQKKRFLNILKGIKEEYTGNIGGETDIANADNLVSEDEFTAQTKPERNVVAKTFDTDADFDSYVNQRRGIEITIKEQQAVLGYKKSKPTQQDKFFIKFETSDEFGNNDTTIIKKLKEGSQFCWTAFSKHEDADAENKPDNDGEIKEALPPPQNKPNTPIDQPEEPAQDDEVTVNDKIRITKTITFTNDTEGANILADFLQKLNI